MVFSSSFEKLLQAPSDAMDDENGYHLKTFARWRIPYGQRATGP
ncbi:hypothetical protein [Paracidovorax citrulli]|uniref:Uncharacterized protein n=1 Tax=Paracidovorax citrulli TaxID=80869 RepID=A0ABY9AN80_PARCI|nr:hypothetical protein [Paracidovorax citrulli]WIY28832.1 hypothetical protein QRO09_17475 [Paracidovorax citrulli]WIY38064.1 hypothetical protein QRO10_17750 [Paracidovorax citrulli]WIY44724.1 hypothetical protein QRO12_03305 [Paracidovorax citrulli]WIY48387.1 hypothetical protein QRO08_21605 [Paracidovorax citrulli]